MKTYTVLYAEDVPHYATVVIEAQNDQAAIDLAKGRDYREEDLEAEWSNTVCKRIVHVTDEQNNTILHDVPLDSFRLQYLAGSVPSRYSIGVNNDDGDCYDIAILQDGKPIATLIATEGEVAPLVHAGNCHQDLVDALKKLRECTKALTINLFDGPFYDAMLAADRALEKAGAA
jgi:hypothetical protein